MVTQINRETYARFCASADQVGVADITMNVFWKTQSTVQAIKVGNLWAFLQYNEDNWYDGDSEEEEFYGLWDSAKEAGYYSGEMPEVWKHIPASQFDPGYDEPIEDACEKLMADIRTAIVEDLFEVEDDE